MAIFFSTLGSGIYLSHKPYMITKDIYAIMAVSSCLSLSIIAQRFLWIAFRIDLMNMMYFFLAMFMFAFIAASAMKLKRRKKKKRIKKRINWLKRLSYIGWGFLMFLFFYQLMLSYLLRPNFLTVMALSISHGNLLLIMWTYVDVKQLYEPRKRRR
ncbi:MAG: hypothetical protein FWG67_07105 [Defluviitaleaceae bacterium]|nr:hypothetical protein [Defluviitaleaceae bacterium]